MNSVVRTGPRTVLPSPFDVTGFLSDAVAAAAEAVVALADARGLTLPLVGVDSRAVATAATSEQHLRIDGRSPAGWAPLSGFFATADGWVRLHGNYPHHAAAVRHALGLPDDAGREVVAAILAERSALDVENALVAAGGVGAAVRSIDQWRATPQGRTGGRFDEVASAGGVRPVSRAEVRPAEGLRVLDLTRVIAGPVAGRTLALWGADVLRLDRPDRPEIDWQHVDLDPGKRTALLDLRTAGGTSRFAELAEQADAVLLGYRPGGLHGLGFGGEDLLERYPHLVVVELSAWGWSGPWAGRRGFDSIVQAATGIAVRCAGADGRPGALPAQALDHVTGYRAASAALDGLRHRPERGGRLYRLSLLRAGEALLARPTAEPDVDDEPFEPEPFLAGAGSVRYARPPFRLGEELMDHPFPARPFGADAPNWW